MASRHTARLEPLPYGRARYRPGRDEANYPIEANTAITRADTRSVETNTPQENFAAGTRTDEASILRRRRHPKECSKDGPLGPSLENCIVMFCPLVVVPLRETCA